MNPLLAIHIAGGLAALVAGTAAIVMRKGGSWHARFGIGFCVAMLVMGVTAAILLPFKTPPETPIGGILVCYFVLTAWLTARRREGLPGVADKLLCAVGLALGALIIFGAWQVSQLPPGQRGGPPGPTGLMILGTICLLAGAGDLRYVLRGTKSRKQRLSRHLWRMCFAFFIATGSFFLGQQDMLPAAWQRSWWLLVPAFAPFGVMLFWVIWMPFSRFAAKAKPRDDRIVATAVASRERIVVEATNRALGEH
jgi:hypothetical protein